MILFVQTLSLFFEQHLKIKQTIKDLRNKQSFEDIRHYLHLKTTFTWSSD